jgi:hypothetical protein
MPESKQSNTPDPRSVRIAREFPLLWEMAQAYDFAERLGGCTSALHAEVDRALREIWDARQYVSEEAARGR